MVKLRGLPFRANEVDVIEFFQGLDVVDVLLVRNGEDGKFNGDAFVVFGAAMQVRCIFSWHLIAFLTLTISAVCLAVSCIKVAPCIGSFQSSRLFSRWHSLHICIQHGCFQAWFFWTCCYSRQLL